MSWMTRSSRFIGRDRRDHEHRRLRPRREAGGAGARLEDDVTSNLRPGVAFLDGEGGGTAGLCSALPVAGRFGRAPLRASHFPLPRPQIQAGQSGGAPCPPLSPGTSQEPSHACGAPP